MAMKSRDLDALGGDKFSKEVRALEGERTLAEAAPKWRKLQQQFVCRRDW
jgi:hypothetical protein